MYRTPPTRTRSIALGALALAGMLSLSACGQDSEATDATLAPSTAPAEEHTPDSHGGESSADQPANTSVVTIKLRDFAFDDVPASVPVGTRIAVENVSQVELHELVAFRLPESETRSVAELMALPPAELGSLFGSMPATVLLQAPGSSETIQAVGDGTLAEAGRYVLLCSIPTGADPVEFLEAAAASPDGPPQGVAGGPPHMAHGMYAELVVG